MIIKSVSLENFRNHGKNFFTFSPDLSIVIGPNTSGKTNLLESIYFLALGKSFRAGKDIETISFNSELARISGIIKQLSDNLINKSDEEIIELEAVLTKGEIAGIKVPYKKYLVNKIAKRHVDFSSRLKVVLFWPQDLQLVTDSPSLRRKYLDYVLMQTDREYRRTLLSFERGMRQRNRLLEAIRDKGVPKQQLMFWDQLLIKAGEYITKKREEYIDFINKAENPNSNPPVGGQLSNYKFPNYQLFYDKSVISRQRLDQYNMQEIAAGVTLVGPHRDDMIFKIKNQNEKNKINEENLNDLCNFGSRGEQRLAILWLKLGELSYIEKSTRDKPVLLLDDILSELDHSHRAIIFDIISKQQTIMTTTDKHFIPEKYFKQAKVIELQ